MPELSQVPASAWTAFGAVAVAFLALIRAELRGRRQRTTNTDHTRRLEDCERERRELQRRVTELHADLDTMTERLNDERGDNLLLTRQLLLTMLTPAEREILNRTRDRAPPTR